MPEISERLIIVLADRHRIERELGGASGARLVWILDWPELMRQMATGR